MISNSIERLDQFIKRILSYSQNNRTALEIESVQIKNTISDIIDGLQNMKQGKGINFEIASLTSIFFRTSEPACIFETERTFSTR